MLEYYERNERRFQSEWLPVPFQPPRDLTIQSSGLCFTSQGRITMVSDGRGWVCPGGYPEPGETLEEALIREIAEEACATVISCRYLGSIRTYELPPVSEGRLAMFYQARYWVRVENGLFNPQHEMLKRIEIAPDQFVELLRWNAKHNASLVLQDALRVESEMVLQKI